MQNREHRQGLIVRRCTRTALTVRKLRLAKLVSDIPCGQILSVKIRRFSAFAQGCVGQRGGYTEADVSASFLEKRSFLLPQEPSALIGKKGLFFVFDDASADEVVLAADSQEQGKDAFSAGDDRNFTA